MAYRVPRCDEQCTAGICEREKRHPGDHTWRPWTREETYMRERDLIADELVARAWDLSRRAVSLADSPARTVFVLRSDALSTLASEVRRGPPKPSSGENEREPK